jgi:hypothetical protein
MDEQKKDQHTTNPTHAPATPSDTPAHEPEKTDDKKHTKDESPTV